MPISALTLEVNGAVKFVVTANSTGHADWGPFQGEATRIDPGQTFRWNTKKIPSGGRNSDRTGLLTADQNK